jgi:hypothetical protein
VGAYNRTGRRWQGHYNFDTYYELFQALELTKDIVPAESLMTGFLDGSLYQQARETFGILPISAETRNDYKFDPYGTPVAASTSTNSSPTQSSQPKTRFRHDEIASIQQTKFAVIHVHSVEERQLFLNLMHVLQLANPTESNFKTMAARWSEKADGRTIFYKVRRLSSLVSVLTLNTTDGISLVDTGTITRLLQYSSKFVQPEELAPAHGTARDKVQRQSPKWLSLNRLDN